MSVGWGIKEQLDKLSVMDDVVIRMSPNVLYALSAEREGFLTFDRFGGAWFCGNKVVIDRRISGFIVEACK